MKIGPCKYKIIKISKKRWRLCVVVDGREGRVGTFKSKKAARKGAKHNAKLRKRALKRGAKRTIKKIKNIPVEPVSMEDEQKKALKDAGLFHHVSDREWWFGAS